MNKLSVPKAYGYNFVTALQVLLVIPALGFVGYLIYDIVTSESFTFNFYIAFVFILAAYVIYKIIPNSIALFTTKLVLLDDHFTYSENKQTMQIKYENIKIIKLRMSDPEIEDVYGNKVVIIRDHVRKATEAIDFIISKAVNAELPHQIGDVGKSKNQRNVMYCNHCRKEFYFDLSGEDCPGCGKRGLLRIDFKIVKNKRLNEALVTAFYVVIVIICFVLFFYYLGLFS